MWLCGGDCVEGGRRRGGEAMVEMDEEAECGRFTSLLSRIVILTVPCFGLYGTRRRSSWQ
jgi:hypothetical protein